jgi:hypothetical protein
MCKTLVRIAALAAALPVVVFGRSCSAQVSGVRPETVPAFQIRVRVLSVGGQTPAGKSFTWRLTVPNTPVIARGSAWSGWLDFDRAQVDATLRTYPNPYMRDFPVVVDLRLDGVADPTPIEAELRLKQNGRVIPLRAELFGPHLGVLLWRNADGTPQAGTMADYNQKYWKALEGVAIPEALRPKRFPLVDRFLGDDDHRCWEEGITNLAKAGFSAIMLPASRPIRNSLLKTGLHRTAWAVYNPPGYAFDFGAQGVAPVTSPEAIDAWAQAQAKPYLDAGYAREDMALFAMSDEPGWYYPVQLAALARSPAALTRFRDYLRAQGLTPAAVGHATWETVLPLGRSRARTLPARRLFYWSMRFYSWDSARHFARCARALETAFAPNTPIFTNWNFFSGRFFVPGPVANNTARSDPDAAMGGHDWLEFGRSRGGTMLWTEDWFGDDRAAQWSYYAARLRSGGLKGGVPFGGYVVPRVAGDREDGILQKALALVGSGGKAIQYYVFGPEYNFPGNCYSERPQLLRKIAEAQRMIGAAEDLLWPGQRPRAQVALLAPRSAQVWDAKNIAIPTQIQDATITNLNGATVDYMAEVYDLYVALQHANIPVDIVEEEDLSTTGLRPFRVLYVTEPNIPAERQQALADWVRGGGTVVMVPGAASRDRYDEPSTVFTSAAGLTERPRERFLLPGLEALFPSGKGRGLYGEFTAYGPRGTLVAPPATPTATFDDGAPAIVVRTLGRGRVVYFSWFPGLSYVRSQTGTRDRLPVGFSQAVRRWIAYPTQLAGVRAPVLVDVPMVETPVLQSSAGTAVTLLSWTGAPLAAVTVTVRANIPVRRVESVKRGVLTFTQTSAGVRCSLPLGAADILMLRP